MGRGRLGWGARTPEPLPPLVHTKSKAPGTATSVEGSKRGAAPDVKGRIMVGSYGQGQG